MSERQELIDAALKEIEEGSETLAETLGRAYDEGRLVALIRANVIGLDLATLEAILELADYDAEPSAGADD